MWEIIGYVALGILALLVLLLIVPVYVRVTFRDVLRLRVHVFGIPMFWHTFADEDEPSQEDDKPSPLRAVSTRLKHDGVGATLDYFKKLSGLAVGAARRLLRAVTVDKLCLQLYVTGDDAAKTAEYTGAVCAALYPAVTVVQQTVLRIKKRAITVTPDFLAEKGRVIADITAHAIPLRVLIVAISLLIQYYSINKHNEEVPKHG